MASFEVLAAHQVCKLEIFDLGFPNLALAFETKKDQKKIKNIDNFKISNA